MKKPFLFTTVLLMFMLAAGLAHSEVNWVHDANQAHSYVFSVEKNGGTFVYPPANYLRSGIQATDQKAYNESKGEYDPYNAVAEGEVLEFGDSIGGEIRMHAMAMGPDQDGSGNPVNPADGLKVQACAQILPDDGAMGPNQGIAISQIVTSWSTRWFTVDEELSYELRAQLDGVVAFGDFFVNDHFLASRAISAEVTLDSRVISETGSSSDVIEILSLPVDLEAPPSPHLLLLSPTNSNGEQLTYQLKTRLSLDSDMINYDWYSAVITGIIDGTFNIGTPEDPIALTATVALPTVDHHLTTMVEGGNGSISPENGVYPENDVVQLTATPEPGYQVAAWTGTDDDAATTTTNTVTMDGERTVTVTFELIPTHTLSASASAIPVDAGSISPESGVYPDNDVVQLTATPEPGYRVAAWTGTDDDAATTTTNTVTMDGDRTVTVTFELIPPPIYTLMVSAIPVDAGLITISPTQDLYAENTVVTLTATANAGFRFDRWEGPVADPKASSTTVVMDQDHQISALFLEILDDDTDGVDDVLEQGPDSDNPDPDYDGNDDGVPDHLQSHVVSMPTHDGQHYVTLACDPANDLREVHCVAPGADAPSDLEFPYGNFDFKIDGIEPGGSAQITIILPDGNVPDSYFKVGPTPDDPSNHWYDFSSDGTTGAIINGNTITLSFVDGQRGDDDLTANALIVDQGGPVIRAASALIGDAPGTPSSESESSDNSCFISVADEARATGLFKSVPDLLRRIGSSFTTGAQ